MKLADKYRRRGLFRLHGGQLSTVRWDFGEMSLEELDAVVCAMWEVVREHCFLGIWRFGYVLATNLAIYAGGWVDGYDPRTGYCNGVFEIGEEYVLVDDVITTGLSARMAIEALGRPPVRIVVLKNRLGRATLDRVPIVEVEVEL